MSLEEVKVTEKNQHECIFIKYTQFVPQLWSFDTVQLFKTRIMTSLFCFAIQKSMFHTPNLNTGAGTGTS